MTNAIKAELIKLRRSRIILIALAIPLVAVITGSYNYYANLAILTPGWVGLWSQITLFYGLFFMTMGIALLAASMWRMEHRGSNWNGLLCTTTRPLTIIIAKTVVLFLLIVIMQLVILVGTWIAGVAFVGLHGVPPVIFCLVALLVACAGTAVAAWQSLFSMVMRSFAAPLALGFVGTVGGVFIPQLEVNYLDYVVPYSLINRTVSMGSSAFTHAAVFSVMQFVMVLGASLVLTAIGVVISSQVMAHREV